MNKKHLPKWANKSEGVYPSFTGDPARVLVVLFAKGNKAMLTNYRRKTLAFFSSTTCVEKVADLLVTYADSPSSTFIGYSILLPGICLRFQAKLG